MLSRLSGGLVVALLAQACLVESSRPPVSAGNGLIVDPDTQAVSLDPNRVPVSPSTCLRGQVVRRTSTGWECAPGDDVDVTRVPVLEACEAGQVVARGDAGWVCVEQADLSRTPQLASCGVGLFVQRTANGWTCAAAIDPLRTPVVATCPSGQFVKRDGVGWSCAESLDPEETPVVAVCAAGHFVQRTAVGWTCAPAINPAQTPVVLACNANQIVRRTATGWDCITPAAIDPAITPVLPGCSYGFYVRRAAGGFECAGLSGALSGSLEGNVTGQVTGNVTGDLTGNVTGNVSGTAANVTGLVAIAHGGTGAPSFGAGAIPILNPAGTAFASLLPGTAGSIVSSSGSAWQAVSPAALHLARRTSADMLLYVRPGGDDANCNGSGNVDDSSTVRPGCAFATLQAAVDAVPDVLQDAVTIRLSAGTYRTATAGLSAAVIGKVAQRGGSLLIEGTGAVILSGATSGSPTTPVGLNAITFSLPLERVTLRNLTIQRFADSGIVAGGSQLTLDAVTSQDNLNAGLVCDRGARCASVNTVTLEGNGGAGLYLTTGSRLSQTGTLIVLDNLSHGIHVELSSVLTAAGTVSSTNNGSAAVAAAGLLVLAGGQASFSGPLEVNANYGHGILVQERSTFISSGVLTLQARTGRYVFIVHFSSYANITSAGASTITCANATDTGGILVQFQSSLLHGGAGSLTSTGCKIGLYVVWSGSVYDADEGTASIAGTDPILVDLQSTYIHGDFPTAAAAKCTRGSICP